MLTECYIQDTMDKRRLRGLKLRMLREQKGWTITHVAEKLGKSQAYLSAIEKGKREGPLELWEQIARLFEVDISYFLEDLHDTLSIPVPKEETQRIPILNYVPAGYPALIPDPNYVDGYIEVPHAFKEKGLFGFKVWGNSMEPELREGDIAIVSPNKAPVKGDIVVCTYNEGETTIKKYYPHEDCVSLISINPEYEPIVVPKNRIKFIGKVIMVMRHYK